jgi:very-short-patch-repair endonuclease
LRTSPTDAEQRLWSVLRGKQMDGYRFRRQHPLGKFVADFVCLSEKLVVEIDGGQHAEQCGADRRRTLWLEKQGFAYCVSGITRY